MEGNLSLGGMIPCGNSYGGLDVQASLRVHQNPQHHLHQSRQGLSIHPSLQEGFPLISGPGQHNCENALSMADYSKGERGKNLVSDDEDPSFMEEGNPNPNNNNIKGKKGSQWQRVKWTDKMVMVLITAVSYVGDDSNTSSGLGGRRKFSVVQKKGKWKCISKVMAERGYHVSPQQCEDKFNDLNKRYKRLNDILGRGTSCQVVENPALLDIIDYLNEKEKDDVRKILSSKHLFYEAMCSYHNGNRLHLPPDPALQRSLQLALRSRDGYDNDDQRRRNPHEDFDEDDDQDVESDDDDDDVEENHGNDNRGLKRVKQGQGQGHVDVISFGLGDMNKVLLDGNNSSMRASWSGQKHWMESRSVQLEEQRVQIRMEMLELETQRLKWQRSCKKRDRELDKMRLENVRMKLENERMALELTRKEFGPGLS